jgi:DegV family protein with EDD domain
MSKIAVIAESSCNLPPELIQQYGIHILPLRLCWQGESLRDGLDISAEQVYQRQESEDYTPRTATISPGELLELVNSLAGRAEAAVAVLLSSDLTSSVQVAHLVRAMDPAIPLHVVDSRSAAMGQGFITLAAARAAQDGADARTVVQQAEGMIGRVHFFAVLETLKYLRRLGRVSLPAALAANALQIKPLIALRPGEGQVSSAGRPRTWRRALECMLELVAEEANGRPMHAAVSHGNRPESAEAVAEQLRQRFDLRELYINHLTPVMGAAAGPTVAVTFYMDEE